jgi:hypothetical protein
MDDDAAKGDTRFLPDFSPDGFFDAFGGLDEAGKRGVPVWWPTLLAAKEDPPCVMRDDSHDHSGVGARE